jgi:hypothetical protein
VKGRQSLICKGIGFGRVAEAVGLRAIPNILGPAGGTSQKGFPPSWMWPLSLPGRFHSFVEGYDFVVWWRPE